MKNTLRVICWSLIILALWKFLQMDMESEPTNSILNAVFAAALLCGFIFAIYKTALKVSQDEYKKFSGALLITHVIFYWVGGAAIGSAALIGLVNGGNIPAVGPWVFLFTVILIPALFGIRQGLKEKPKI